MDLSRARRLLDDAGLSPGPDGVRFRLTYKTSSALTSRAQAAVVQDYLSRVGIGIDIVSNEWSTYFADVKKGQFELASLVWVGIADPDAFRARFHSAMIPPQGANRARYRNPELDLLLEEGEAVADRDLRRVIYADVQEILDRDPPLPLSLVQVELRPGAAGNRGSGAGSVRRVRLRHEPASLRYITVTPRRTAAEAYGAQAEAYDTILEPHPFVQEIRRRFRAAVEAAVPASATLLDLGCGTGRDAAWFGARGHRVVGVDASDEMLAQAKTAGVAEVHRLDLEDRSDWEAFLNSSPPRFDLAYANLGVVNCLRDPSLFWRSVGSPRRSQGRRRRPSARQPLGAAVVPLARADSLCSPAGRSVPVFR